MASEKSEDESSMKNSDGSNGSAGEDSDEDLSEGPINMSAKGENITEKPEATLTPPEGSEAIKKKKKTRVSGKKPPKKEKPIDRTKKPGSPKCEKSQPNQDQGSCQDRPRQSANIMNICNSVVILLVLAGVCIFVAISLAPPEPEMKTDFDFVKIFENKITELQSSFTNQTDRFWRLLKNRGMAHLRNTNPPQPLVLLLAAPPAAHDVVDCLATKLAQVLDPKHKRALAMIDGTEEKRYQGDKAKKKMDNLLIKKFKEGHRAALVHHLELLPPPSPLLFYSYCDDQNAPHKHVAIIFTVHLPAEPDPSLSPKEAEGTVEKYLSNQVWGREDQDAVAALLSRIADTVALMNGEAGDSVEASCS